MYNAYDVFTPIRLENSRVIYFVKRTFKNGEISCSGTLIISMHISSGPCVGHYGRKEVKLPQAIGTFLINDVYM